MANDKSKIPRSILNLMSSFIHQHSDNIISFNQEMAQNQGRGLVVFEVTIKGQMVGHIDPRLMKPSFIQAESLCGLYGNEYHDLYETIAKNNDSNSYYVIVAICEKDFPFTVSSVMYQVEDSPYSTIYPIQFETFSLLLGPRLDAQVKEIKIVNDYQRKISLQNYLFIKNIPHRFLGY